MGRRYYPLDRQQVEYVLKQLNFEFKRQQGSHAQWEGMLKMSEEL